MQVGDIFPFAVSALQPDKIVIAVFLFGCSIAMMAGMSSYLVQQENKSTYKSRAPLDW